MKLDQTIVAFDCDGTLITYDDEPREKVIDMLRACRALGMYVVVWSGGGLDYARTWVSRLGLDGVVSDVWAKPVGTGQTGVVDIAFDDYDVKYGKVNVCVGPGGPEVWPASQRGLSWEDRMI